jgi:hypothetical protein
MRYLSLSSEAEWQKYLASMGIRTPGLTASKSRKLAITMHRKGEATKEQQVALARQIAHNVGTGVSSIFIP